MLAGATASLTTALCASPICSAYCQWALVRRACRRRCDGVAALRAVPLFAVHAMLPLLFDGGTAAVVASLLAATLYTWWASMKVAALLLSSSGPLAAYADAPPVQFWCVFFLPVTAVVSRDAGTGRSNRALPHALAFVTKLSLALLCFAALNPAGDGLPVSTLLSPGHLLGDLSWLAVVLLAASGLMDISNAIAELAGVHVLPSFDAPLLACSLTDFWGRRWNLTASRLLRDCVYRPCHEYLGWSRPWALGAAFAVSGAAHELIVWYGSGSSYASTRGQWFAFFLVQGGLAAAERSSRRVIPIHIPHAVSRALTIGILVATARRLFLPPAYELRWPFLMSDAALWPFRRASRAA